MGRGRGGQREDLGIYVRSSWEGNYARYLNWLKSLREIQDWQYEPKTFEFPVKRGSRFYTPDFRITNNDGSVEYHEVKGYMDSRSQTKLKRMARYYPQIKVLLVDKEQYDAISKQARNLIPNWELPPKQYA